MDNMERLEGLLIRDLRAIAVLAQRGHFALAAEEFGISQPALSAIVQKVEKTFGATLFSRSSRRFCITQEGEAVIRQIHHVLDELSTLSTILSADAEPLTGRFRLGILPTLGPYFLPHVLGVLRTMYPTLELVLVEDKTGSLLTQLRQRELDAALMAYPEESPDVDQEPLFREPFVLAVPETHALADLDKVSVHALDVGEMLVLEAGNCLRDQILNACGSSRVGDVRPIHAASLETLRLMVATGIGTAIMPRLAVPSTNRSDAGLPVRYIPFTDPEPSRIVGIVSSTHSCRKRDIQALAMCLRTHLPRTVTAVRTAVEAERRTPLTTECPVV